MSLKSTLSDIAGRGLASGQHEILRNSFLVEEASELSSIEWLLDEPSFHWPYIALVKDGVQSPPEAFSEPVTGSRHRTVDAKRVRKMLAEGSSLKIARLQDWSRQASLCVEALREGSGLPVSAYAFKTPAGSRALDAHRDPCHVLVVQMTGAKQWSVYEPTGNPRTPLGQEPKSSRREFTLKAGDTLFLPLGWTHAARTDRGESLHLTFTLTPPSSADNALALARDYLGSARFERPMLLAEVAHEALAWAVTHHRG